LDKLKEGASGLVTWALSMPAEWSRIGQEVEELNDIGGNLLDPSGMLGWIDAKVRHLPGHELPLGAKQEGPPARFSI